MSSYYGKRREFTVRTENLDTIHMTVTSIMIEGIHIFVEYPDDGPPIVILQAADGSPIRVGGLAVNVLSVHREKS